MVQSMTHYVLIKEPEGGFSIISPIFPVSSCGETKEEAIKNFQEAINLHFDENNVNPNTESSVELGQIAIHA